MGDHRQVSGDSRGHMDPGDPAGTIPENEVIGRAFWIVWPPGKWRVLPIPATFGQPALNSGKAAASSQAAGPGTISARIVPVGPAFPLVAGLAGAVPRSEEHTSELQSRVDLVCRLLLEKKKNII